MFVGVFVGFCCVWVLVWVCFFLGGWVVFCGGVGGGGVFWGVGVCVVVWVGGFWWGCFGWFFFFGVWGLLLLGVVLLCGGFVVVCFGVLCLLFGFVVVLGCVVVVVVCCVWCVGLVVVVVVVVFPGVGVGLWAVGGLVELGVVVEWLLSGRRGLGDVEGAEY
ncbi:hypothetical protein, partial [Pseudomonas syringae group genomosp. 7]|uniref:hypothetical protein n=1 Tax=Pseudomonas syringae group genomosp. 7 TaxID=251699 RepID=UPI00376FFF2C